MNPLEDFVKLKETLEELKRRNDQLQGAQQQLLQQLKELCGGGVEEAKREESKLEKEEESLTKEYEVVSKRFEEKWKDKL